MPFHTAVRMVLMFSQILMMLARNLSTSTPALSSRLPSRELLPCMKLMKSSTNRAIMMIFAAIKRASLLTPFSPLMMAATPLVILSNLNANSSAPAAMASSFSRFPDPPSLSLSHTTAFRTRFITRMAVSENFTIALAIVFVTPSVLSICVSQSPHWLRMTVKASVILYCTPPNFCSMVLALSTNAAFRSATVIVLDDAISSSLSEVVPSFLLSSSTASGERSKSWLIVSLST